MPPADLSPATPRPSSRRRPCRRAALALRLARRALRGAVRRLALLTGWTWVAAGSLIGFEAFELLFGAFALAPELLPLAILALALAWYFRERLRRARRRLRARLRLARIRRRDRKGSART